jgi:hypothetical protein
MEPFAAGAVPSYTLKDGPMPDRAYIEWLRETISRMSGSRAAEGEVKPHPQSYDLDAQRRIGELIGRIAAKPTRKRPRRGSKPRLRRQ